MHFVWDPSLEDFQPWWGTLAKKAGSVALHTEGKGRETKATSRGDIACTSELQWKVPSRGPRTHSSIPWKSPLWTSVRALMLELHLSRKISPFPLPVGTTGSRLNMEGGVGENREEGPRMTHLLHTVAFSGQPARTGESRYIRWEAFIFRVNCLLPKSDWKVFANEGKEMSPQCAYAGSDRITYFHLVIYPVLNTMIACSQLWDPQTRWKWCTLHIKLPLWDGTDIQ